MKPSCLETLRDLGLDYIDLYLIHWPQGFKAGENDFLKNPDGTMIHFDVHYNETWGAMEKLVEEGLVKHIGLSNFNSKQIDEVIVAQTNGKICKYFDFKCVILSVADLHVLKSSVCCTDHVSGKDTTGRPTS